jgi:hypothetical protein
MRTREGNDRIEQNMLRFWTPSQVTKFGDPRPKFGAGSRSLGDLAPGSSTGVSPIPMGHERDQKKIENLPEKEINTKTERETLTTVSLHSLSSSHQSRWFRQQYLPSEL